MTPAPRTRLPWWRRPPVLAAVGAAHLIGRLPPARIRAVLELARRGAAPATAEQAKAARDAVMAVSLSCAGEGCLPRSIATALLCRLRGSWPTWCAGVRVHPFAAHAWVEAGNRPIDEPPASYHRTIVVPPLDPHRTVAPLPSHPRTADPPPDHGRAAVPPPSPPGDDGVGRRAGS
ncbi:lasso peptide biosynthesis B2 protein [Nonomuraea sp. PA05]|nr:lasso peptide biosynthesis B2 protein [Nonomuraea sp. PA05]